MLDSAKYDPLSPKTLDYIVGNKEIWSALYAEIQTNCASNTVLVGPPGCGKSLFLKLALKNRLHLHIECTANAGLRDVRDSIRTFARGGRDPARNLRWIVFEHADSLMADTQAFLRRMLETTAGTTRFVFECKDAGAISEPILSRASIVSVAAPDETEIKYEINRRTQFKLDAKKVDAICDFAYGNVRTAVLNGLGSLYAGIELPHDVFCEILLSRPSVLGNDEKAWVLWAIQTEAKCRDHGLDLRDVLRLGWSNHPAVNATCATWPRLGGTSPRTLFFDCVKSLCGKV